MTKLLESLNNLLSNLHGSLTTNKVAYREMDDELIDIYAKVYGNPNMSTPIEDKINLHKDVHNFKKDFKKSLKKYKSEVVNG